MAVFLIEVKILSIMVALFMFYRLLISREPLPMLNHIVSVVLASLSFILSFCIITIRYTTTIGKSGTKVYELLEQSIRYITKENIIEK